LPRLSKIKLRAQAKEEIYNNQQLIKEKINNKTFKFNNNNRIKL